MVGSTDDKVMVHLIRDWKARELLFTSQLYQDQEASLAKTSEFLQKRAEEKNIAQLLADEDAVIKHSLKFDSNSSEESQSLKAAILQLADALKCLKVLQNDPQGYAATANTYPARKKEAGLPLDAMRDFLNSHSARLTNRLAGKGSPSEKFLLRQRKENLKVVKECYVELQGQVLGLKR